ncbi:ABC transporter substrate-binding protein [Actinoplanes derwentensis]|uniref:Iron complex transport system substrate-binding protein n=1 Tax=Actinoplanes derwentensis TaxID=113562 RepID=A0A1H1YDE5_9ACTN|nr:ABC transporter substrate-binding protein [Actinoplanes derwentensis]GID81098.1 ABC transporter substrate-binding protein [Actinoplanes derwentensis]SDT19404.1 iron complex transport system substrate-binding protein [Actinoplanes derwentensis]
MINKIAGTAMALVASLALTACGGGTEAATTDSAASTAPAGPFEYTDALGKAIKLDKAPSVVVAQSSVAAALLDAGFQVKGAYGELKPDAAGKLSYQAGSLDLNKITVVGSTYGEFDTEKYALMNPELLVDYTFDAKTLWYVPAAQSEKILGLAPAAAVPGNYETTDEAIETFVDLAGKLGADTARTDLTTAKADYTTALTAIGEAAKASGLKVAIMSPGTDSLYVADPAYLPEGNTLKKAGLDVVSPENPKKEVFAQLSWEQATQFTDADVILVDARTYDAGKADLAKVATWANLPAVKAGQVYNWYAAAPYSYQSYAKIYAELAAQLKAAKKL